MDTKKAFKQRNDHAIKKKQNTGINVLKFILSFRFVLFILTLKFT